MLWGQPAPTASIPPPSLTTAGTWSGNQFDASQFTDPANRAYDILSTFCGPQLALTFSKFLGKSLTPDTALQIAEQYGYRRGMGMSGPESEKNLLDALGIPVEYRAGVDWNYLAQNVGSGAIGGVSTPGHYFSIEGYNPSTGQFDTGQSGTAYKAGSRFLTPQQIINLGGSAQGQYLVRNSGNMGQGSNVPTEPKDYGNPWANRAAAIAGELGINPDIFVRQIRRESNFNPTARSPVGASGLAQLMPDTARGLGVKNIFDPEENLRGGARFMADLLRQYNGDYRLALAAYNAGPGNVAKYGGVPPFEETRIYLQDILGEGNSNSNGMGNGPVRQPVNQSFTNIRSMNQQAKPTGGLFGQGSLFGSGQSMQPPTPQGGFVNAGAYMSLFANPFSAR